MTMSSHPVTLEIDTVLNVAYVRLSDEPVKSTRLVTDAVNVDLDDMSVVVGVEVLDLAAEIPFTQLKDEYHVRSEVLDRLRSLRPSIAQFVLANASEGTSRAGLANTSKVAHT